MVAISEKPPVTIANLEQKKDRLLNILDRVTTTLEQNGTNLFPNAVKPDSPNVLQDILTIAARRKSIVDGINKNNVPAQIGERFKDADRQILEIAQPLVKKLKSLNEQGFMNPDEVQMYESIAAKLPKIPEPPAQDSEKAGPADSKTADISTENFDPLVTRYLDRHSGVLRPRHVAFALGLKETPKVIERVRKTLTKRGLDGQRAAIDLTPQQARDAAEAMLQEGVHGIDMNFARQWKANHEKQSYTYTDIQAMAGRANNIASLSSTIKKLAQEYGIDVSSRNGSIPAEFALNIVSRLKPFNALQSEAMQRARKNPDNNYKKAKKDTPVETGDNVVRLGPTFTRVAFDNQTPVPQIAADHETVAEQIAQPAALLHQEPAESADVTTRPSQDAEIPPIQAVQTNNIGSEATRADALNNGKTHQASAPEPAAPVQPIHLTNHEIRDAISEIRGGNKNGNTQQREEKPAERVDNNLTENAEKVVAFLKLADAPMSESQLLRAFPTKISAVIRNSMLRSSLEELRKKRPGNIKTETNGRISWFDPKAQQDAPSTPELTPAKPAAIDNEQAPETSGHDSHEAVINLNGHTALSQPHGEPKTEVVEIPKELIPDATDLFSLASFIKAYSKELKEGGFELDTFAMSVLNSVVAKNFAEANPNMNPHVSARAGIAKLREILKDEKMTQLFREKGTGQQGLVAFIKGFEGKSPEDFFLAIDNIQANRTETHTSSKSAQEKQKAREEGLVWQDDDLYSIAVIMKSANTRKLKADSGIIINPPDNIRLDQIMRTVKTRFSEQSLALPELAECFDILDVRLKQLAENGKNELIKENEGSDARWILMRLLSGFKNASEINRFRSELQNYRPVTATV